MSQLRKHVNKNPPKVFFTSCTCQGDESDVTVLCFAKNLSSASDSTNKQTLNRSVSPIVFLLQTSMVRLSISPTYPTNEAGQNNYKQLFHAMRLFWIMPYSFLSFTFPPKLNFSVYREIVFYS